MRFLQDIFARTLCVVALSRGIPEQFLCLEKVSSQPKVASLSCSLSIEGAMLRYAHCFFVLQLLR